MATTRIDYKQLQNAHGNNADTIAKEICAIHGGLGFTDFKAHNGGIDFSGCSDADQAKIQALISKKNETKEGK